MNAQKILRLHSSDNVAVACRPLRAGDIVQLDGPGQQKNSGETADLQITDAVGLGHKLCIRDTASGEPIRKYGQIIGFASRTIRAGEHVHVHNLEAGTFDREYEFATDVPVTPAATEQQSIQAYLRPDGRVGTRNYIAVISTVNCSASTSKYITARFPPEVLAKYPNVDGLLPLTHKSGCGMQYDGQDHDQLNRVLAGFARHPNVGGYLLVGLGCEIAQIPHLVEQQKLVQIDGVTDDAASDAPPMITIQDMGGIGKTIDAGIAAIEEMLPRVNTVERTKLPASSLILGLQCGGSDGNSGITANPALGTASDLLIQQGGTAVLGETTEIYGAEHLLTRRAANREIGEALIERIRWWEWYTGVFGAKIDNNPSPGNKAGGLTTIYEKSLGAVAKGGTTALRAVYRYAEEVREKGFVVMDTPGYDPASLTGIVAGGSNICVFTTGRGSVYGCKPTPCIKIATNTPLYDRMRDDMDIDAGVILEGASVEEIGSVIFDEILAVASGKKTRSELQNIGEEEFSPWSIGPVL